MFTTGTMNIDTGEYENYTLVSNSKPNTIDHEDDIIEKYDIASY